MAIPSDTQNQRVRRHIFYFYRFIVKWLSINKCVTHEWPQLVAPLGVVCVCCIAAHRPSITSGLCWVVSYTETSHSCNNGKYEVSVMASSTVLVLENWRGTPKTQNYGCVVFQNGVVFFFFLLKHTQQVVPWYLTD